MEYHILLIKGFVIMSTPQQKKNKISLEVERTLHKHMDRVKEGTIDFVHLYIQKNNIPVDRPSLAKILDIVRLALDSEHMNKMDIFLKDLDSALTSAVKDE
jgi:propanediol dehydratase large subunit